MDFKNWILTEMPITNFNLVGNWDNNKRQYGFNRQDQGILTNPKAVEKIHKAWSNTKQNYSMFFVRSPVAYKHMEVGEVQPQWVKENLGLDIPADSNSITVIFTNNIGAEKIPMTGWMMAHRFGHAIKNVQKFEPLYTRELERDFSDILDQVYNKKLPPQWDNNQRRSRNDLLKAMAHAIGSMRSATSGNLFRHPEFYYELLAQYMTTGKIKFNPLPTSLITQKRFAWGKPNHKSLYGDKNQTQMYSDDYLPYMEEKYTNIFDEILGNLVGKIFVM